MTISRTVMYKGYSNAIKGSETSELARTNELVITENEEQIFSGIILFNEARDFFIGVGLGEEQEENFIEGTPLKDGNMTFAVNLKGQDPIHYVGKLKGRTAYITKEASLEKSVATMTLNPIRSDQETTNLIRTNFDTLSYGLVQARGLLKRRNK